MLSPVICSSCLPRSPSGQQDDVEHTRHAENDGGDPGNFDVGNMRNLFGGSRATVLIWIIAPR
jgi:hypothetical protein